MVRGYHVYKDVWDAVVGDELQCIRETSNRHDPFAVAVIKNMNEELNDKHIYVAQRLLPKQFPFFKGLNSTLVHRSIGSWVDNYIQIMHCRMNHWITATTIGCEVGEVSVYDSLYSDIDNKTKESIQRILCMPDIKFSVPCVQKQNGVKDCGLFAIAFTAFLVNGNNPEQLLTYTFQQDELRNHLVKCLEQGYVTPF